MTTLDQKIVEFISTRINELCHTDWPVGNLVLSVIAILLAVIFCGAVGIERELRGRSAGLRTHLLVGVGSCVLMIVSIYGFPSHAGRDAARLAAAVVAGVGFLGAGAIINRTNGGIKGLTTAATIWIVMSLGLLCGSFNFILAIVAFAVIMVVLTIFKKVEVKLNRHSPLIVLTAPAEEAILGKILTVSKRYDCRVHGISTEMIEGGEKKEIQVTFQAIFKNDDGRVVEYISELENETNATSVQLYGHQQ